MKHSFYGDTTVWGIGVVEDINDPSRAGRVRVRIYGLHSEDDNILPTSDLPWSQIAIDATNAGISGLGKAPIGLVKGSLVHGKFMDGMSKQNFLVEGVIIGLNKRTRVQGEIQGEPTLQGNSNPEIVFNYLRNKGFEEFEATGIVAGMIEYLGEKLDPGQFYLNQRFGLGLWDDNQLRAYREYVLRQNSTIEDLETQLEFLVDTLSLRGWPNFLTKSGKTITPTTAPEAATAFIQGYYNLDTDSSKASVKKKASEVQAAYGSTGGKTRLPLRVPPQEINFGSHITSNEQLYALLISSSRDISELIVHHADTYENMDTNVEDIDSWHKNPPKGQQPFDQIGYHFIIRRDGRIQVGRNVNTPGAHARGRNEKSIGIAFIGGRRGHSNEKGLIRSADTFTDAQWKTFDKFIGVFLHAYPNSNLLGHRDVDPERRTDPEFDVKDYVRSKKPMWVSTIEPSPSQTIEEVVQAEDDSAPREALNPAETPAIIDAEPVVVASVNEDLFEEVQPVPFEIKPAEVSSVVPSPFEDPVSTIAGQQNPLTFATQVPTTIIQQLITSALGGALGAYLLIEDLPAPVDLSGYALSSEIPTIPDHSDYAEKSVVSNFTARPQFNGVDLATLNDLAGGFDTSGNYTMTGTWDFSNVPTVNSNNVWHAGNDGSGSGLDADLLDGQQGSFYLDYANITGVPTSFTPSAHTHDGNDITTGILHVDRIPNLDAAKINSGVLLAARIPTLPYIPTTEKAVANGVATLDANGKLLSSQVPALAIVNVFPVADITARNALTVETGDVAIVADTGSGFTGSFVYDGAVWREMSSPGQVTSVAGQTGVVTLSSSDVGLGNVNNTSDLAKPISTATQTALNNKVGLTGNETIGGAKTFSNNVTIYKNSPVLDIIRDAGQTGNPSIHLRTNGRYDRIENTPSGISIDYNWSGVTQSLLFNGSSLTIDGNTAWHAGNDGSGSGLDADLLDGVQGSSYLRSDASDIYYQLTPKGVGGDSGVGHYGYAMYQESGPWSHPYPDLIINYHTGIKIGAYWNYGGVRFYNNNVGAGGEIEIFSVGDGDNKVRFKDNAVFQAGTDELWIGNYNQNTATRASIGVSSNLHIDSSTDGAMYLNNYAQSRPIYMQGPNIAWHAGNDGSGSGLDADLLDGYQGAALDHKSYNTSNYLGAGYTSGGLEKPNVFGSGRLRLQMLRGSSGVNTGSPDTWNDVLWMSSYTGADVKTSNALVFGKTGNSLGFIQSNWDATSWGTYYKIFHAGNDGSGSGLDADLLDGVQGSSYARSDASDTHTGTHTFYNTAGSSFTAPGNHLQVQQQTAGQDAYMAFHVAGDYAVYFGIDGGTNQLSVGGWSMGANVYKVFHEGNDGSGSGLDADLLDGIQETSLFRANGSRTLSGDIQMSNLLGDRIAVYGTKDSATSYAIGIESSTMYYRAHQNHRWYVGNVADGGVSDKMQLTATALTVTGSITATGDITAFSDKSLKTDIKPYENFDISKLEVKRFKRTDLDNKEDVGIIAQEVQEYFPEAVIESEDGILSVNYAKLAIAAIAAQKKNSDSQINRLHEELKELRQLINTLKK